MRRWLAHLVVILIVVCAHSFATIAWPPPTGSTQDPQTVAGLRHSHRYGTPERGAQGGQQIVHGPEWWTETARLNRSSTNMSAPSPTKTSRRPTSLEVAP